MIDEYNYSAENLLYHFCSILRGNMGFMLGFEKMDELKHRESLDDDAVEYMKNVFGILSKIGSSSTPWGPPFPTRRLVMYR